MGDGTLPVQRTGVPVRALRVSVVDGPDQGVSVEASDDWFTIGSADGNDLTLSDRTVSAFHVELRRVADRISIHDLGSTNGTMVGEVRVERAAVVPGTTLQLGETRISVRDGEPVLVEVREEPTLGRLVGATSMMRRLMSRLERAAASSASVVLVGESGTGKELAAHAIHDLSDRRDGPFITVDCAALPRDLVANELFGHERGAYTGADRRYAGAFERADGGTLFLDEVGELPAVLQPTLLGVLERRRFRRVGGDEELESDVRLICATNRDLRAEVNSGAFRLDLYYRIAVVRIATPALREHPEDILILLETFLREGGHHGAIGDVFAPEVLGELSRHHWPGNVRELRNLVEATLAMGEAAGLELDDAGRTGTDGENTELDERPYKEARQQTLRAFERRYLERLLERADGNVSEAARLADLDRSYLFGLLKRNALR